MEAQTTPMAIGGSLVVIPLGIDILAAGLAFGLSRMARERGHPTALAFAAIGNLVFASLGLLALIEAGCGPS